jgi:AcrR family transcriptional regulator
MPNRARSLDWDAAPDDDPARAELVEAALAIADEEGLDAVSIRRLAARLGRRPMSIYTHVASKDDLVALMFDRMGGELLLPEPVDGKGREPARHIARRAFDVYLAHPWMLHALGRRPAPGPSQTRRAEQSAAAVTAMGVRADRAWIALGILHEWTMGHALHVVTLREDSALAQRMGELAPPGYPDAAFGEALEAVLDGIEARFAGPGSSA